MLVSYLWLKELTEFSYSPEELASVLTNLGLEADIADNRRGWYANMVIGKVESAGPHPNADRLSLCQVNVGAETKQIVCGAPNVAEGQTVAVALTGAELPDGTKIEKRKVRGEVSDGMILSEAELQLSDDHSGIMVLDGDHEPGSALAEALEIGDTIIEIDLTPNRGDCLSMIGVAREIAALTGAPINIPPAQVEGSDEKSADKIKVQIDAPELCPRYAARYLSGLKAGPSPLWMRIRLNALGVRSINNLVDVTNYVLMETGHPLHAFDYSLIDDGKIIVRRAGDGERFKTLDDKEHKLNSGNLVIADPEKPVALAGVMGGQNSEVSDGTTEVLLESAYFDPACIRRTGKEHNIKSESSFRFERGCDVEGLIYAQDRAAHLMIQLAGGAAYKGTVDAYPTPIAKKRVTLRYGRVDKILGIATAPDDIKKILSSLEMGIVEQTDEATTIEAPYFRHDIEREADLIEEIARFVGYDKIESAIPQISANADGLTPGLQLRRILRRHLRSVGMAEGLSYSFTSERDLDRFRLPDDHELRRLVKIDNPLSSEWTHLRSTILPALVSASAGMDDGQIFEIGVVFTDKGDAAPVEKWVVAGVMTANVKTGLWNDKDNQRDFYHAKGIVESILSVAGSGDVRFEQSRHPFYYPKRQADVLSGSKVVGHLGQIHPEILEGYEVTGELLTFELDIDRLTGASIDVKFETLPKFPSVKRDLAVLVDKGIPASDLIASISKSGGAMLKETILFDVYEGANIDDGARSMAFSLEFRDEEKTLTDDDVNVVFDKIVSALQADHNARLRS